MVFLRFSKTSHQLLGLFRFAERSLQDFTADGTSLNVFQAPQDWNVTVVCLFFFGGGCFGGHFVLFCLVWVLVLVFVCLFGWFVFVWVFVCYKKSLFVVRLSTSLLCMPRWCFETMLASLEG